MVCLVRRPGNDGRVATSTPVAAHVDRAPGRQPGVVSDGRFLAYSSDRSGNFDIWVQPVAEGSPIQVTSETSPDTQPTWSPDSKSIAFRSHRDDGGIFIVSVTGG